MVLCIVISDEITIVDCDSRRPLRRHKCNFIARVPKQVCFQKVDISDVNLKYYIGLIGIYLTFYKNTIMENKKKLTITDVLHLKKTENPRKLSMLTAYDATSARLAQRANVDMILVGDSLGMTIQGKQDTNSVTLDQMIYHTKIVVENAPNTLIVADMPFLSYEQGKKSALKNVGQLFRETNVRAVKLEGGKNILPQIKALVNAGIPVVGHLGLTPQRANMFGGFKAQAKTAKTAFNLLEDALALEKVGCFCLVLEAIPAPVAKIVSKRLNIPTIGIGAGSDCDGQVLVFHDLLGLSDFSPRFVKKYADLAKPIENAIKSYVHDVENMDFPSEEHTFKMPDEELAEFLKMINK